MTETKTESQTPAPVTFGELVDNLASPATEDQLATLFTRLTDIQAAYFAVLACKFHPESLTQAKAIALMDHLRTARNAMQDIVACVDGHGAAGRPLGLSVQTF